jgi:hypothetical protein
MRGWWPKGIYSETGMEADGRKRPGLVTINGVESICPVTGKDFLERHVCCIKLAALKILSISF